VNPLIAAITSREPEIRDQSLDSLCAGAPLDELIENCAALDQFRRSCDNLYERVRALFFLYAIHRFHIPRQANGTAVAGGLIPFSAYTNLLRRRFQESIDTLLARQAVEGPSVPLSSGLAAAYRALGFQTLADQVRRSVRSVRGNQWMFRTGDPSDYALRLRPELLARTESEPLFAILREATPVRMDLTHSGWSDIFFLGMDYPEGARVLNVSIDLAVRGSGASTPQPPVEAYFRVIEQPVLRLTSVDLRATADVSSCAELFDFARDYLGLLKAAVIASGLIPSGMEGSSRPLADLLERLIGRRGRGIEIVSKVNDIPKGSRLAVSTSLLSCLISVCMRATRQIHALTGELQDEDRRLVAARAILGEWLGGSGGGWQDSGGVWPGIKLIYGVTAEEHDPEYGTSRGCLLPRHRVFGPNEIPPETRRQLQDSLVLVHGGMAQDVGPILEMVTEKYLLRSQAEWEGRREAVRILDQVLVELRRGDIPSIGRSTQSNFDGPIQTIIPWAGNLYTDLLIRRAREAMGSSFQGFWMLGGMSGGGMGFLFSPPAKAEAQDRMAGIMRAAKCELESSLPFAIEPVVYDFAINERGTIAELRERAEALMPSEYYTLMVPPLLRTEMRLLSPARRAELDRFSAACRTHPQFAGMVEQLFDHLLPRAQEESTTRGRSLDALLEEYGFDRAQHERIQADFRAGRIGLAQNRLPRTSLIEDPPASELFDARHELPQRYRKAGLRALAEGAVAVVSMAGGIGSRWTRGAGVVKALNPFCRLAGQHRSFLEVHLAKSLQAGRAAGTLLPHIITTSYLTHSAIEDRLRAVKNYGYPGPLFLSPGRAIGLRLMPTERDLRFAWEETPQQLLDEQAQKVRTGLHAALIGWARQSGEGSDYRDNLPMQCLHPVGHWYEIPNLLRSGLLARLLSERPNLRHLLVHNIDTVGVNVDASLLGYHIEQGATMTAEVIERHVEDRGGGLAVVDGRLRLVEGMALPDEEIESRLSFYNSATYWIDIDRLLRVFSLERSQLADASRVGAAIHSVAARIPTYITLKDVKKRWGKGQEDVFPVAQFEKLWGDMTALAECDTRFVLVPRMRGQQLKEPAQLDGWLRDGSAAFVESLCDWGEELKFRGADAGSSSH
jgi:hypothetical protein